ncbi:type II secretion system F family protein [Patescibacteria group bacterium]|nr:type II secretion system F family protein [Patescibacteria group bacterium]
MADSKKRKNISLEYVRITDKVLFTKNLALMLKAGLTINEALNVSVDQANGSFKKALEDINDRVTAGTAFSEGLRRHPRLFSTLFVSIVRVGEKSGTLVESLNQLTNQLEKERTLKSKITQAMMYPVIVLITLVLVGAGISIFVLPKLTSLFNVFQGEIPFSTQVLLWIVDVMSKWGIYIIGGGILLVVFLILIVKTKPIRPIWHALLLRIPVIGKIARNLNLARTTRNLGTLLQSGLPIVESLDIVSRSIPNESYKRKIHAISEEVQTGTEIHTSMEGAEHIFPKIASRMIAVGERSGRLDEVLLYLADFYENEVDKASQNLSTTLEPILLVIVGIAVGFVALAIITPIYQLTATIAG